MTTTAEEKKAVLVRTLIKGFTHQAEVDEFYTDQVLAGLLRRMMATNNGKLVQLTDTHPDSEHSYPGGYLVIDGVGWRLDAEEMDVIKEVVMNMDSPRLRA